MFITIISSALCLAAYNVHVVTVYNINSQQAYFTARSATAATIEYIQKNADNTSAVNYLTSVQGKSTSDSMGDCTVTVSYVNGNTNSIKIASTATYKNQTSTVSAYLTKSASTPEIPTDKLIYVNGPGSFGQCTLNGNVYVNGNFTIGDGSKINGQTIVNGTTSFTGGSSSTKDIIGFGDIKITNGAVISGNAYSKGNITTNGGVQITKDAYCDGTLSMSNGDHQILGDAFIGSDVSFGGKNVYIKGLLTYWGTMLNGDNSYAGGGATKKTNYTPLDLSSYVSAELPKIDVPSSGENSQLYVPLTPLTSSNKTVSSSGTMDAAFLNSLKSLSYQSILKVNTSSGAISLLLNSDYNVGNGISLEVSGSHNLYIYLTGSANFDLSANQYAGTETKSTASSIVKPQIYIIGSGSQSVNLTSDSELDAFIYLPNGTFSASGSPLTTYKFIGSCIAKSFNVTSDLTFQYSQPNTDETSPGGAGSGSAGWTVERWSDN